jgi:beta-1,4-mannosyltransferase
MSVRVSSLPADGGENPYIRLYIEALARHGITTAPPLRPGLEAMRSLAGQADVIHIHWKTEDLWRDLAGRSRPEALLGVYRFWRTLRMAKREGIRIVWTLHDVEQHEWAGRADRIAYRVLAAETDMCICHDANAARQFVDRLGGTRSKVVLMPHGNFDGEYRPTQDRAAVLGELGLDLSKRTLACVGAIRPYKNFQAAAGAMDRLGDGYQLVIAGVPHEPATAAELREMCEGRVNCRFVARRLSAADFSNLVTAADCLVLPYRKITGSGVMLAAGTLGRGVVTSDLPFFREFLAEAPEAGVVARSDDPVEIARAVEEFFTISPEARGAACRRLADRYPWEAVVAPVVAWYRSRFPEELGVLTERMA